MKPIFASILLFIVHIARAQVTDTVHAKENGESILYFGYANGKRIDSIKTKYVQVNLLSNTTYFASGYMYLTYGQVNSRFNQFRVTDKNGSAIDFPSVSVAFVLNFMNYNGWELVNLHYGHDGQDADIIFKKKNKTGWFWASMLKLH